MAQGSKKVLLNASPWGTLDTLYPRTTIDLINTKDTTRPVFPEISSEYVDKALILSSDGVFVFGEAGKVDDVRVLSGSEDIEGISVVKDKIARLRFVDGIMTDSEGNIRIDKDVIATAEDIDDLRNDLEEATSELNDRIDNETSELWKALNSEIDRSKNEDSELWAAIRQVSSELDDEILRATNSERYIIDLLGSEISRATNSERYIIDLLNSEIYRSTNSERYIIDLLNSESWRAKNSEGYILDRLDAEVLRATNSERFIINKINSLDLPDTFIIQDTTDSSGNRTYRIPRTVRQQDGQLIVSSDGVVLGSAAALDYVQRFTDSESNTALGKVIPTASAVRDYVGDGNLTISFWKGGTISTSERVYWHANADTNSEFHVVIPVSVSDLRDRDNYYLKTQIDNKFQTKTDSQGLNTTDKTIVGAINEVLDLTSDLSSNKQDKLTVTNAGEGVIITVDSSGQLNKISLKPNLSYNTIIVDSAGIRGNYAAGKALELQNYNTFNVLYDNDTIKVSSDGELYFAKTIEDLLPSKAGKNGRALMVDSTGTIVWDYAGKVDEVTMDGSESRIVTNNRVVNIQQIDASIIKGTVESAIRAEADSAGNIITNTYQKISNLVQGLGSETDKYPSVRAVQNALDLKQDKLSAGAAIDKSNLDNNVVRVRYDGITVALDIPVPNSEGNLQARNIKMTGLSGSPYITQIIPTDTKVSNKLVNEDLLNYKILSELGNYIGLYTSESYLPTQSTSEMKIAKNDYAYVTTKTSEGENLLHRYKVQQQSEGDPINWAIEYTISLGKDMLFSPAQVAAMNSGITEDLVSGSEGLIIHIARTDNPHNVTADDPLIDVGAFKGKTVQQVVSEGLTLQVVNKVVGASNSNPILLTSEGYNLFKVKQTIVNSPTVSSEDISFIDTISQNEQGVITATKKTVRTVTTSKSGVMTPDMLTKLNSIADGATRVQVSNINGNIKINGSESTVYELPIATTTRLGGVKIGNGINVASDGTISSNGTTYTFNSGTNGSFTVTPSNTGVTQTVTVLPIAGSEGNGRYLHKNSTTGNLEWSAVASSGGGGGNDGILYLKVNGSNVNGSPHAFTANTADNVEYDLTIPVAGTGLTMGTASGRTNVLNHSNSVDANATNSLKSFTYDAQGHINAATNKTLGRGINDQSNVIGHSNTAVTAGTLNNNTAVTSWATDQTIKLTKAPYDTYGHIGPTPADVSYTIGQSDWDNNTTTSFDYIKNRPNIRLNGHTASTGMNTTGTVIGNSANVASGNYSLATGGGAASGEATTASGIASFATGLGSVASGNGAAAFSGTASGVKSFSVGYGGNVAAGGGTITAGRYCTTDSNSGEAIAAGYHAQIGRYGQQGAFSLGHYTYNGDDKGSTAIGYYTRIENGDVYKITSKNGTEIGGAFVNGSYNNTTKASKDDLNLITMTGIGDSEGYRANGMALTTKGDLRVKGKVYIGCNDDSTGGTELGTGGASVKPDWDERQSTSEAYIDNRPNIRLNGHTSNTGMTATGTVIGDSDNIASGNYSLAQGSNTAARGTGSHTEGISTQVRAGVPSGSVPPIVTDPGAGNYSHAEGYNSIAYGSYAHAEGQGSVAFGDNSHAEGMRSYSWGKDSHAEGQDTSTENSNSHAEGDSTRTTGKGSHAEGKLTTAGGEGSHTEGLYTSTSTSGGYAHAEGYYAQANSSYSHAEGSHTKASMPYSHAEGYYTNVSHTIKSKNNTTIYGVHVDGSYNNTTKASSIDLNLITMTGIGDSEGYRANGMALTTKGDLRVKGKVYIGCNDDSTGGVEAGGSSHYGTCVLPVHAAGSVNVTPVFEDGYQLDGNEHPVLDVIPTTIDTAENEISNWGAVYKASSNADHSITFYLMYATTSAITVQVLV